MFKIFGKHYGAERFFILSFVMMFGMIALFGYSMSIQHERNQFSVGTKALYTTSFRWSRTSASGSVVKLVSNSSHTSMFLLIRNDDVGMTSTNADDYQVFMTGTDEKLVNSPAMTIYTFGLTGYVGFYFKDARGFANQRYSITLRADSAASKMADESLWDKSVRDQSFRDHNQTRIIVNFGATGIETLPVMDEPGLTPMKIMCDLNLDLTAMGISADAGSSSFNALVRSAQKQLVAMNASLTSIAQYRATLEENGVVVPDLPYYIANDWVDTIPNDFSREPMVFDLSMLPSGGSGSSGTRFTGVGSSSSSGSGSSMAQGGTTAGNGATYIDGGREVPYMYLHTDYLWPGTAQVVWQGTKLSDGLISQTKFYVGGAQGLDEAYADYAKWCTDCVGDYAAEMPYSVKYQTWRKMDGDYIDMKQTQGIAGQLPSMINKYVAEVNNYMKLKSAYLNFVNEMLRTESLIQALRPMIYSNNGSKGQNLWLY